MEILARIGIVILGGDGRVREMDEIASGILGQSAPGTAIATLVDSPRLPALRAPAPVSDAIVSIRSTPGEIAFVAASRLGPDSVAWRVERPTRQERSEHLERATARLHAALHRRDLADALQWNQQFLATLVQAAPMGIVFVDAHSKVHTWNPAAAQILGWSALEVIGQDIGTFWPERATEIAEIRAVGRVDDREIELRRKDGSPVFLQFAAVPLTGTQTPGRLVVFMDVSERRRLTAQIMALDRMSAVGTLAAGVAHEINNPLAYVLANLEFVSGSLAELPDGDVRPVLNEVRAALDDARNGARRVRDVVRDLKTFSRPDRDEMSAVSLDHVLESSISMAWNEIRHRATLVRETLARPAVLANDAKLGQVFLNLLMNAAQSIPEGHASENRIVVRSELENGMAIVTVEDSGCGIEAAHLSRVFDPFFTTRDVGQGAGLGLSVCLGIVRALGGTIEVVSKVSQGTSVRVCLPALPEEAEAAGAAVARAAGPILRPRVLVVDDEPLVLVALRRALEPEMEVQSALGGKQALEKLAAAPFDMVLCDLMMPDVDGVDIHAALQSRDPDMARRMVFLTGGAFTARARRFAERDGVKVVEKPFDPQELRAVLRARMG